MGGGSSSSGEGYSKTTPGFMDELGTVLRGTIAGTTGFSKQDALSDVQGVMRQQATSALQEAMPKIAAQQTQAGAYNSTTKQLLSNDLQARITGQLAQTQLGAIKDYAAIGSDQIRAAASATQAGTASESQHFESSASRKGWLGGVGEGLLGAVVGGGLDMMAGDGAQNGGRVPYSADNTDPAKQFLEQMISTYNLEGAAQAIDPTRAAPSPEKVDLTKVKTSTKSTQPKEATGLEEDDELFKFMSGGV